ncbi:MAG: hypothetical protein LC104_10665 [Bacteroidales bacterium]|nr:hypothetical protein [Bacteroidales bacterium]
MRLNHLPLLAGFLVAPIGLFFITDSQAGPKEKHRLHEKLERHTSEDGRFRVLMPDDDDDEDATLATAIGPVRVNTLRGDVSRQLCLSVSYSDFPDAFTNVAKAKLYDGLRDALKGVDGQIDSEKDFTLGTDATLGREFDVLTGRNQIRCRVVLVGKRLYQIMATGERDFVRSQIVAEFFDSFELIQP